jgi:hypothetical protein
MNISQLSGPVLAVHPTFSGFGWVVFEAGALVDWGIASANQGRKLRLVDRFKRLLVRHEPAVLVIEAHHGEHGRADRIRRLYRAFDRAASAGGAKVCVYDRKTIATLLGIPRQASRYDVALWVAERLVELSHRMPRPHAFGASEDPRQPLFSAAALALAHFAAHGVPTPPVHPGAPE